MTRAAFDAAVAGFDTANAADPNHEAGEPAELLYGQRMSAALERLDPEASEVLRLAVRAQHIERWKLPRSAYPDGKAGYHRWRNEQKRRHAEVAGAIMATAGYGPETVARVGSLIRKERLQHDVEAQALEDVACLVFLEHYGVAFAAKHPPDKTIDILRKTWGKMSARGQQAALALPLAPEMRALVGKALAADG